MFKKAFIVFFVLILAVSVFSIRLIDPLSKELSLTETNTVGTVAQGNTLELIFSKELTDKYESIENVNVLPTGFDYDTIVDKESLKLFIHVPKSALAGDYPVSITLVGPNKSDTVVLSLAVVENALDVSPSNIVEQVTHVDGSATYTLFFLNKTDADATFTISTNLQNNWMNESAFALTPVVKKVTVPKHSTLEESFVVFPRQQGKHNFVASVAFANTSKEFAFSVNAQPTLKSKLSAVMYGLPFYSFSLLPSYFINGIIAFYLK